MSDTLLFPTEQSTQDSANGSLVHIDSKVTQDHALVASSDKTTEIQKITALKSGNDWYQNDLSHMTTNLMRDETNKNVFTSNNEHNQSVKDRTDLNKLIAIQPYSINSVNFADQIETWAYIRLSDNAFSDILGRNSTQNEAQTFVNTAKKYGASAALRGIVYSQEVYNRIAQMDQSILGYNPSDDVVRGQQEQLCQVTRSTGWASSGHTGNTTVTYTRQYTMTDIRHNLVYSQAVYDAINNVTSSLYGQPVNQETIQYYQTNLANGWLSSLADVRKNFANSQVVYDVINNVTSSMYGQPVNQETIKFYQANLANGASLANLRYNFAHSEDYRNRLVKMVSDVSGEDMSTSVYAGWISSLQDAAGSWAKMAELRNNFINSL